MSQSLNVTPEELKARIRQRTLDLLKAKECCVICLEVVHEPCEAKPCQHHQFDYICLTQWLSHSPRCPLCVTAVTQVEHRVEGKVVVDSIKAPQTQPEPHQRDAQSRSTTVEALYLRDRTRHHRPQRHRGSRELATAPRILGLNGRKAVYQQSLYSKHVGSNRLSQYSELTPSLFERDESLVSRARMWLRRELQVFSFLAGPQSEADTSSEAASRSNHTEFLMEYIIAILKSVDIAGGQAENMVTDFLGRENTRLFLHELRAWLRSPYTKLEDWDRAVQYGAPLTPPSNSAEPSSPSRSVPRPTGQRDYYRPKGRDQRSSRTHPYERSVAPANIRNHEAHDEA